MRKSINNLFKCNTLATMFWLVYGLLYSSLISAEQCADYNSAKNPYFGDLHVHTSFSMDALTSGTTYDPDDAYEFAKGLLSIPSSSTMTGEQPVRKLIRPLDFAAVTDHAEGLASVNICFTESNIVYHSRYCRSIREPGMSIPDILDGIPAVIPDLVRLSTLDSPLCELLPRMCKKRRIEMWNKIKEAADDHNSPCEFTTFSGYEYTGLPLGNNTHRNVIFKNSVTPKLPIDYIAAKQDYQLWNLLDSQCTNVEKECPGGGEQCSDDEYKCEVITIPHNGNLSGGAFFKTTYSKISLENELWENDRAFELGKQRQRLEPLFEIYQNKGASECMNSQADPLGSQDEMCNFEQYSYDVCEGNENDSPDCMPLCSSLPITAGAFLGACAEPMGFARNALRAGLEDLRKSEEVNQAKRINPIKIGFVGGTDTHNATPGLVREKDYTGQHKIDNSELVDLLVKPAQVNKNLANLPQGTNSPGSLAVVWAKQNTRSELFRALQNKEAYATSGPRIIARFFGGWDFPDDMCQLDNFAEIGYQQGVPMGGDLSVAQDIHAQPEFAVAALMDSGTEQGPGTPLQKIQIIKGWEENGQTYEQVIDVAGSDYNGAGVDLDTCTTYGVESASLCTVWRDTSFNPAQHAFYYARVVENPSCRWHKYQCNAYFLENQLTCDDIEEDSPLNKCCVADDSQHIIQERAWTSPIWYSAP